MLDVKQAVEKAQRYLKTLYRNKGFLNLMLEEVELSSDDRYWLVTLGWDLDVMGTRRTYKVFKIDAETGEVISMKIRAA